jgi:hypothetical protein
MCIAEGYRHDIFLSYAHKDDEPAPGPGSESRPGWVSLFYDTLNYQIRQQLPATGYSPWKDDELRYDQSLSGQLLETVSQSAILLVMMSPNYMQSDWCRRERTTFLQSLSGRGDAPIIVVEKTPVEEDLLPAVLRDRLRLPFWTGSREEPRTLGFPLPNVAIPEHAFFYSKIDALSREITKVLSGMKRSGPLPGPGPAPLPPKALVKPVFLAQVTDDLEEERDGIRAFLDQHGIAALPETGVYYPPEPNAFSEAALRDLASAGLFVQLLSDTRGRRPAGLPQGYAALQWELVTQRLGRAIPILQWRSPALDVGAISDPHLSALMQLETVRAESMVDFQRAIVAALAPPPPPPPPPVTNILVFVNVDSADRQLAEQVEDILARNGAEVSLPAAGSDCAGNREDLENNLRACDGLIVIYGATTDLWVRRQLLEFRKQRAFRDSPLLALSIFEGPPPVSRPPVGISLNELEVQDCRAGSDNPAVLEQEVRRFLERVRERQQATKG